MIASRLISMDPVSAMRRVISAGLLLTAGNHDAARAEFVRTVELIPPMIADVDVDLAHLLMIERRIAEALEQSSGRGRVSNGSGSTR